MLAQTTLVFGQMDEPPGVRFRVAQTGVTMAEYFRDELGADVLLFMDNIFRYLQAGSEVSALMGRMPSAVGYQPTLGTDMGGARRAHHLDRAKGRLRRFKPSTSRPTITPTRPSPSRSRISTRPRRMSRPISELGIYPAVDPLASTSRILDPQIIGEEALWRRARGVQEVLQRYKDLQDIIAILGVEELAEEDKIIVGRARRIQRFLLAARSSWPSSSPDARANTSSCPTRSRRSRKSSTARSTICRSRRSSTPVTIDDVKAAAEKSAA